MKTTKICNSRRLHHFRERFKHLTIKKTTFNKQNKPSREKTPCSLLQQTPPPFSSKAPPVSTIFKRILGRYKSLWSFRTVRPLKKFSY
jgi:hypothetical protein